MAKTTLSSTLSLRLHGERSRCFKAAFSFLLLLAEESPFKIGMSWDELSGVQRDIHMQI